MEDIIHALLLDFDGVLNSVLEDETTQRFYLKGAIQGARQEDITLLAEGEAPPEGAHWFDGLNPDRVELLHRFLEARPNLQVVFSTSWSNAFDTDTLYQFLVQACPGWRIPRNRFHASDTARSFGGSRVQEISNWVEAHPETSVWLALDDINMEPMFPWNAYCVPQGRGITQGDLDLVGFMLHRQSLNLEAVSLKIYGSLSDEPGLTEADFSRLAKETPGILGYHYVQDMFGSYGSYERHIAPVGNLDGYEQAWKARLENAED